MPPAHEHIDNPQEEAHGLSRVSTQDDRHSIHRQFPHMPMIDVLDRVGLGLAVRLVLNAISVNSDRPRAMRKRQRARPGEVSHVAVR
jgi:hypothetical protein